MTEESQTNSSVTETVSIEDKLFTINYDHSHETHITCIGDPKDWEVLNPLQWACPARVYTKNQDTGNLDIDFENCMNVAHVRYCVRIIYSGFIQGEGTA